MQRRTTRHFALRVAWTATLVTAMVTRATRAQGQRAALDVGGGTVTIDDFARSGFSTLGLRISGARKAARGDVTGSLTRFESGNISAYGTLQGEIDALRLGVGTLVWGLDGGMGAYRGMSSSRYGRTTLRWEMRSTQIPSLVQQNEHGAWVSGSAGGAYDVRNYGTLRGETGIWGARAWPAATLVMSGIVAGVRAHTARYAEFRSTMRLLLPLGHIELSAGARPSARRWMQTTATAALTPSLAIVVTAGTDPGEPDRAITGSRSLTFGLRWTSRDATERDAETLLSGRRASNARSAFTVGAAASDGSRLVQWRVKADSVEIMGNFTDWQAMTLQHGDDDVWSARIVIPEGMHRLNVRVNGGEWRVPPGLPAATDDFEGKSGVLVVK